jgi:hypothetical protein
MNHPTAEQRPIDVKETRQPFDHETAQQKPAERTLLDWSRELEFFTPALLVQFGKFDRDPVIEVIKHTGIAASAVNCESPLFSGLGKGMLLGQEVNWDHRLYCVPTEHWTPFRDTLNGIAWRDVERGTYNRAMFHELDVFDPTTFAKRGGLLAELPFLTITVFGVSNNKGQVYLEPASSPPQNRPSPKTIGPRPEMVQEAAKMLGPITVETLSRHRKDSQ